MFCFYVRSIGNSRKYFQAYTLKVTYVTVIIKISSKYLIVIIAYDLKGFKMTFPFNKTICTLLKKFDRFINKRRNVFPVYKSAVIGEVLY